MPKDRVGPAAARRYVARSEAAECRVRARLSRLTADGAPLIVWGAGTYMQHLLAQPPLADAAIVAVVDANPRLHGLRVAGHVVTGPEALAGRDEPILVGSPAHEADITDMARRVYGLRNRAAFAARAFRGRSPGTLTARPAKPGARPPAAERCQDRLLEFIRVRAD